MDNEARIHRVRRSPFATILLWAALLSGLVWGTEVNAQAPGATRQEIRTVLQSLEGAIKDGNAEAVFEKASRQVDVSILGETALYSKAQAQHVVRKFFSDNPPERFAFTEDDLATQRRFAFGLYYARKHQVPYRVYVYLRDRDGLWELREFRIEASEEQP